MAQYGSEVTPNGPLQPMEQYDALAGTFPPQERETSQATFGGGITPQGGSQAGPLLGGQAIGVEPQNVPVGGV